MSANKKHYAHHVMGVHRCETARCYLHTPKKRDVDLVTVPGSTIALNLYAAITMLSLGMRS
ncbi:hypothetical protein [Aggregatibacter actinomycetemcomitans]|uniref:Uncharacterized protein n=1 Tax=Aggregatibacter actinomycetemcomitans TaxID=714 RepID=A0AB74N516_AGGAC|nr:hypothetical protein [Aggregatibacter actinomycetemcomitans]EKX97617.1 hypothetical protein HMPREF9996_00855 [Aggregatibacter actinomycetemcomitans Y4]MBN6071896.1 hypothetical protein [Aggregatibacter actinomycetemcomitans]TYA21252.1 hypothetical protein FXE08_05795 [Aggregatibacter actinomycetemcomitans]TYA34929.1 hypothetical protein FXB68_05970 [Aggregatibacter actinomycetemcomitans]TYA39076.1 hypothetical protein FXB79_05195 [Aggregatibacter actinomycetemcomitans]